ncbi:MAG: CYTH domain-containing protein [Lentisphaeria bacterium]|nr:CYTH domain-containing protein [Lentisphaeria bacterium]
MALEIERKFLVKDDSWRPQAVAVKAISQAYLTASGTTVRVRMQDGKAMLAIKGKAENFSRLEFEYPIPAADAEEMFAALVLDPPVEKKRYIVPAGNGLVWEIDEYEKANAPLFTAEIELPSEDTSFDRPAWLGEEISADSRYTNRALSRKPYSSWSETEK